jgi:AcrR family transcriptional regulator
VRRAGRPERHSADAILDAARGLVLEGGARAATIDGVVAASGAPKGSIYHRFATLDDLLAAMWLRAVQRAQAPCLAALDHPDAFEGAVRAGLAVHDFARAHPADARLLVSMRREDLARGVTDPAVAAGLREANAAVEAAVRRLATRLYRRASRAAVERTLCAVVDPPLGAIRRHLVAGTPIPPGLRAQLEAAIRAALLS